MKSLANRYKMLLAETDTSFVRDAHESIDWNAQLVSIVGARSVGKTTLVLQYIKLHENTEKSLFVFADDL